MGDTLKIESTEFSADIQKSFFSEIQKSCLRRNFGTLSKGEFDILLFHYYLINKQRSASEDYISDYDIGKELGLTIQRVRSLREKDALKYGYEDNWKTSFLKCVQHAHCDVKGNIKIPVPDVNVIKEVRCYLESVGLFDEYQLNPKVFQCELDVLVAICVDLKADHGDDDLCKSILCELRKNKDGNVVQAIAEREHPIRVAFSRACVKAAEDLISQIPGVGGACVELFTSLLAICNEKE